MITFLAKKKNKLRDSQVQSTVDGFVLTYCIHFFKRIMYFICIEFISIKFVSKNIRIRFIDPKKKKKMNRRDNTK